MSCDDLIPLIYGPQDVATLHWEINNLILLINAKFNCPGPPFIIRIPLTANQLNHLHSAPVTLLPAPGVGKAYQIALFCPSYIFNTQEFTLDGATDVFYGSTSGVVATGTGAELPSLFGEAASSAFQNGAFLNNGVITAHADIENMPLILGSPATNAITPGDGSGSITLMYIIQDL